MKQAVLARFGLTGDALLGAGAESWVYGLDEDRILRVAKGGAGARSYLEACKAFYDALPALRFALPVIDSIHELEGTIVSIENRMPGQPLSRVLPGLSVSSKRKALANYLDALDDLQCVDKSEAPFGELVGEHPMISLSWGGFLAAKVRGVEPHDDIKHEVPGIKGIIGRALDLFQGMPDPVPSLVHGDYFPENVLVNDELEVTGIIDFGPMTVVGDPLMDVAGSLVFLELSDRYTPDQSEVLQPIVEQKYGSHIEDAISTYSLYYALCYIGAEGDDKLRRWCALRLKDA